MVTAISIQDTDSVQFHSGAVFPTGDRRPETGHRTPDTGHRTPASMLIGVIGAGGWGTALAKVFYEKGHTVTLWCHSEETLRTIRSTAENRSYLPNVHLPDGLEVTNSLERAAALRDLVVCATPSHHLRSVITRAAPFIGPETIVACGSKGIEESSLKTMGEVLVEVLGPSKKSHLAFLSGPTFAAEVARGLPTALTVASPEMRVAIRVQESLSTSELRVYTSTDVIGVQMGGVIKNPNGSQALHAFRSPGIRGSRAYLHRGFEPQPARRTRDRPRTETQRNRGHHQNRCRGSAQHAICLLAVVSVGCRDANRRTDVPRVVRIEGCDSGGQRPHGEELES